MSTFGRTSSALLRMIKALTDRTSINQMVVGSKSRYLLEIFDNELRIISNFVTELPRKVILPTSTGKILEQIGTPIIGSPFPSRQAEVSASDRIIQFSTRTGVTFGELNSGNSFTIPSGTQLWAPSDLSVSSSIAGIDEADNVQNRTINWSLTSSVFCPADSTGAFASAKALSPGRLGNLPLPGLLVGHGFTGYRDYLSNSLTVTNLKPIISGANEESETGYKYRISKAWTTSEAANDSAVSLAVTALPGVSNAIINRWVDGPGRFDVFLDSISPIVSDSLLDEAQTGINRVQAVGCMGYSRRPFEIGLELESLLRFYGTPTDEEKNQARVNALVAVSRYVTSLGIGSSLFLANLASVAKSSDSLIRFVGSDSSTYFDSVYVYYPARLESTGRRREKLLSGSLTASPTSRIIIETSLANPIRFQ